MIESLATQFNLDLWQMIQCDPRCLIAKATRIALDQAKTPLAIWIPPRKDSGVWAFYAKVEATFAWLADALEKYERKNGVDGITLLQLKTRARHRARARP